VVDLEDVRLARIARRRYGLDMETIARAFDALGDASLLNSGASPPGPREGLRSSDSRPNIVRVLHERGWIDSEQALDLARLQRKARPAGLKLVSVLGKGSSATVFEGRDAEGNRFAVKVMKGSGTADYRRREHEVQALDRLRHPAIPRLLSLGEINDRPFYVMDLVPGETLAALSEAKRKLDSSLVVEVGLAIARALEHVHARGMVHRDVKPSNVLVTEGGARLLDFGLACRRGEVSPETAVGTPGYMSPELARGERASAEADVYSFGAMLYFTLTGHYPFEADSAPEMIRLAADPTQVAKPLLAYREDLPPRLIAVVEGCMEKDPSRRPSCAEIVVALERCRVVAPLLRRRRYRISA
jgi:serine/threonine-protein kinase